MEQLRESSEAEGNDLKLVSVIVPVYNVIEYLEKCVNSIMAQTYQDIEIVLVDDGSTDGSTELCDLLAKSDGRITTIHKNNTGVSETRNIGIEFGRGEYICFVDADDWVDSKFVEELISCFEKGVDLTICGCYINRSEGENEELNIYHNKDVLTKDQAMKMMMHPKFFSGSLCNKMFKRDIFEKHHIRLDKDIRYCEDMLCCAEYMLYVNKIVYHSIPLYHYRIRGNSAVNFGNHQLVATGIKANLKILGMYVNEDHSLVNAIRANCACMALRSMEALSTEKTYSRCMAKEYRQVFLNHSISYYSIYSGMQRIKGHMFSYYPFSLWLYFKIKRMWLKI